MVILPCQKSESAAIPMCNGEKGNFLLGPIGQWPSPFLATIGYSNRVEPSSPFGLTTPIGSGTLGYTLANG